MDTKLAVYVKIHCLYLLLKLWLFYFNNIYKNKMAAKYYIDADILLGYFVN